MAGLVLSHLMHCVMNGIEVEFLGTLGNAHLVGTGSCSANIRFLTLVRVLPTTSPSNSANFDACSASSKA